MAKVFSTPEISLPAAIKFSDCEPVVQTSDFNISRAYLVQNFSERSAWTRFIKGPSLPPIEIAAAIEGNVAEYVIYFNQFDNGPCPESTCNLSCSTVSIDFTSGSDPTVSVNYCANGERPAYNFRATFESDSERFNTPVNLSLEFTDALANSVEVPVQSISNVKPLSPVCATDTDQDMPRVYVGVVCKTANMSELDIDQIEKFIIQKSYWPTYSSIETFEGKIRTNNNVPLKERTHMSKWTDTKVSKDQVVSYRIAFINKWGEQTQWSDWTKVNPGHDVQGPGDDESIARW